MSENHAQRASIVLVFLLLALAAIFSPVLDKLFHPHKQITQWLNLKPGIDMVGGTSLLYEIKQSEGTARSPNTNLAEKVMTALKKRVDPNGVKNLVWRPQGNDRLEIQMPFSGNPEENKAKRDAVAKTLRSAAVSLNQLNITKQQVQDAVEQNNGKTRADLDKMAAGNPQRIALFKQLTDIWDKLQAAHKAKNADEEARLRIEYDKLLAGQGSSDPVAATNLTSSDLDNILDSEDPQDRKVRLAEVQSRSANFPDRLKAIDTYVSAFDERSKVKGSLDDAEDLKRMLRGSGVLEFHIVVEPQAESEEYRKMSARLQADGPRVEAGDQSRWYLVDNVKQVKYSAVTYGGKSYVLCWTTPEKSLDHRSGQKSWALKDARSETLQSGETVVAFTFNVGGGVLFGELTGPNKGHPMAVVLDDKVINVATIQSKITESGTINGGSDGFSQPELEYLVNTLTAGSLPAQLAEQPISERQVGPQIGGDNLKHGLIACGLGLVVVAVFLVGYYYVAGIVATFAVFMNVVLILGVMAALNATFTLPSIAGIVLTIGTAVDANVLIFERLREEQHRGLSLRLALRNAYGKAFSAILDSNMTTVITSLFLIWFGTEEVKGFGITLIIGIVASLFTALFVTRTIFGIMIDVFGMKKLGSLPLTFPKWDKALRPSIDWMGMAWGFAAFSVVAISIGLVMFAVQWRNGKMLDIEFASGTSVQFQLKQPMKIEDVRELIKAKSDVNILPSPSVVTVKSGDRPGTVYEVITPNAESNKVKDQVLHVFGDNLEATLPSKFEAHGEAVADAMKQAIVVPVTTDLLKDATAWPGHKAPERAGDFVGGVAIFLRDLEPNLSVSQIRERVTQQQLQADTPQAVAQREIVVIPEGSADEPTSTAVVLTKDENLPYVKDKEKWQDQLAGPMWQLVNNAVNRPAQLQQVKNFDSSVAGDARNDALLALVLSVLAIMAYIWVRFGNLKYGTATVVALVHDTIFTIAALGFAHYIFLVPGLRDVLQIEQFRISLTVVAGILTVMGYSMIDTIVVFDRIRENRGKYGHVSRQVINDAINQTLSRTLLTAGTNVVTVAIMYFFGGPGIHGFTFVLLIGILVGTYSSVAIAAPILLIGNKAEQEITPPRPSGRLQRAGA